MWHAGIENTDSHSLFIIVFLLLKQLLEDECGETDAKTLMLQAAKPKQCEMLKHYVGVRGVSDRVGVIVLCGFVTASSTVYLPVGNNAHESGETGWNKIIKLQAVKTTERC